MVKTDFYVYRLFDEHGKTQYVGKGSGRRLINQKRIFKLDGEVVKLFSKEKSAFAAERDLIALHKPPLNKTAGGDGGCVRRRRVVKYGWEKEIERIGSRRFVARALLKYDLSPFLEASKIAVLRQVANGPWC